MNYEFLNLTQLSKFEDIISMVIVGVVSFTWVFAVDLYPSNNRPYVDSSTNNTVIELLVGHNRLERIYGQQGGGDGDPHINKGNSNLDNGAPEALPNQSHGSNNTDSANMQSQNPPTNSGQENTNDGSQSMNGGQQSGPQGGGTGRNDIVYGVRYSRQTDTFFKKMFIAILHNHL